MDQFHPDNAAGFTQAECDAMNLEVERDVGLAIADLQLAAALDVAPDPTEDTLSQIRQAMAVEVLRRHRAT